MRVADLVDRQRLRPGAARRRGRTPPPRRSTGSRRPRSRKYSSERAGLLVGGEHRASSLGLEGLDDLLGPLDQRVARRRGRRSPGHDQEAVPFAGRRADHRRPRPHRRDLLRDLVAAMVVNGPDERSGDRGRSRARRGSGGSAADLDGAGDRAATAPAKRSSSSACRSRRGVAARPRSSPGFARQTMPADGLTRILLAGPAGAERATRADADGTGVEPADERRRTARGPPANSGPTRAAPRGRRPAPAIMRSNGRSTARPSSSAAGRVGRPRRRGRQHLAGRGPSGRRSTRSAGPPPWSTSTDSVTSRPLPAARPSGVSMRRRAARSVRHAVRRAEADHRLGQLAGRGRRRARNAPGTDLHVEHERVGALGDLLRHDRAGDERDRLDRRGRRRAARRACGRPGRAPAPAAQITRRPSRSTPSDLVVVDAWPASRGSTPACRACRRCGRGRARTAAARRRRTPRRAGRGQRRPCRRRRRSSACRPWAGRPTTGRAARPRRSSRRPGRQLAAASMPAPDDRHEQGGGLLVGDAPGACSASMNQRICSSVEPRRRRASCGSRRRRRVTATCRSRMAQRPSGPNAPGSSSPSGTAPSRVVDQQRRARRLVEQLAAAAARRRGSVAVGGHARRPPRAGRRRCARADDQRRTRRTGSARSEAFSTLQPVTDRGRRRPAPAAPTRTPGVRGVGPRRRRPRRRGAQRVPVDRRRGVTRSRLVATA